MAVPGHVTADTSGRTDQMHFLPRPTLAVLTAAATLLGALVVVDPAGAQAPTCFGQVATIVATPGQVTVGTRGPDVIVGTPGDDVIRGLGGADLICSGAGNDDVRGGGGRDRIATGEGRDVVRGGPAADTVFGGGGHDTLRGGRGDDELRADDGVDRCIGGQGRDSLFSCNEPATSGVNAHEAEMIDLVHDLRTRHGVRRLEVDIQMVDVARTWSVHMTEVFQHNPEVASQIPRGWRSWGENVAYNSSVNAAFDALVASDGHFSNMIDPRYTHLGVGVHIENGRVYVTQVFAGY